MFSGAVGCPLPGWAALTRRHPFPHPFPQPRELRYCLRAFLLLWLVFPNAFCTLAYPQHHLSTGITFPFPNCKLQTADKVDGWLHSRTKTMFCWSLQQAPRERLRREGERLPSASLSLCTQMPLNCISRSLILSLIANPALENRMTIGAVETDSVLMGVDTPEDLKKVNAVLMKGETL